MPHLSKLSIFKVEQNHNTELFKLPLELWLLIAKFLGEDKKAISAFSRSSKTTYNNIQPFLLELGVKLTFASLPGLFQAKIIHNANMTMEDLQRQSIALVFNNPAEFNPLVEHNALLKESLNTLNEKMDFADLEDTEWNKALFMGLLFSGLLVIIGGLALVILEMRNDFPKNEIFLTLLPILFGSVITVSSAIIVYRMHLFHQAQLSYNTSEEEISRFTVGNVTANELYPQLNIVQDEEKGALIPMLQSLDHHKNRYSI